VRRVGWITTNSVQLGLGDRIDDQFAAADVVDRNYARQNRDPVGARDEFEALRSSRPSPASRDFDAVALEVSIEVARRILSGPGTTIFSGGHSDSRTAASGVKPARGPEIIISRSRTSNRDFEPDGAFEGRHHREVEFVIAHHFGDRAAIALNDVQPHFRASAARKSSSTAASTRG